MSAWMFYEESVCVNVDVLCMRTIVCVCMCNFVRTQFVVLVFI